MRSVLIWNKKQEQYDKDNLISEGLRNTTTSAVAKISNSPFSTSTGQAGSHSTVECPADDTGVDQTARIAEVLTTPEISQDSWIPSQNDLLDDNLWQRMLEDFTLLPPAPIGGFPAGAFAPYAYP